MPDTMLSSMALIADPTPRWQHKSWDPALMSFVTGSSRNLWGKLSSQLDALASFIGRSICHMVDAALRIGIESCRLSFHLKSWQRWHKNTCGTGANSCKANGVKYQNPDDQGCIDLNWEGAAQEPFGTTCRTNLDTYKISNETCVMKMALDLVL